RETLHREVGVELHPIFDQVHAFFVAARKLVFVVALHQRGHGEQVFDGGGVLARIAVLHVFAARGREHVEDARGGAGELAVLDRQAREHARDGLGGRARVAPRLCTAFVEVVLVDDLAVLRDQDAGDGLEVAVFDGLGGVVELGWVRGSGGEGGGGEAASQQETFHAAHANTCAGAHLVSAKLRRGRGRGGGTRPASCRT